MAKLLGGDSFVFAVGEAGDLVENAEWIAERATATAYDNSERVVGNINSLLVGDLVEMLLHNFGLSELKSVDLGARGDGNWYFVGVGSSHNENHVLRWFLKGL